MSDPYATRLPTRRLSRRALLTGTTAGVVVLMSGCSDDSEPEIPLVPAHRSEDLVRTYAINTRFRYDTTVYGYTESVVDLVAELGVRVVRERLTATPGQLGTQNLRAVMPALASTYGVRWHATCLTLEDIDSDYQLAADDLISELLDHYAPLVPEGDLRRLLHSLGGPNEVNQVATVGPSAVPWYDAARALQTALWQRARQDNSQWDAWVAAGGTEIGVGGPSTRSDTTEADMQALGDLTSVCDLANAHLYQKGGSPAQGLDEMLELMSLSYGDYPCLVTEAGYNNSPQTNASRTVPEWASNIYAPKAPCAFFKRGAVYFRYALLDEPDVIDLTDQGSINATADNNAHYGLVAMTAQSTNVADNPPDTWRKKAEFHTMRRWIALLSDRDPSSLESYPFAPKGLRYLLSGAEGVEQLLVQKHDGRHYLLVWREVEVFDADVAARSDGRAEVDAQDVELTLATSATVTVYAPSQGSEATAAAAVESHDITAGDPLRLSIGYDLMVFEIS